MPAALADNLQRLMDHHGLSQNELARRCGIGQRTLSTWLDKERALESNPRLRSLDQVAAYFGLPGWLLLVPGLSLDLLLTPGLALVMEHYRDAGERGRETIARVAETEARYAAAHAQAHQRTS